MASNSESSGDSGSSESSKTNTYTCIQCFQPFPTPFMLIQHQSQHEHCRRLQMMKTTINNNTLNPLSFSHQPIFHPLPSPSISVPNKTTLDLFSPMLSSSSPPPPPPPPRPVEPYPKNLSLFPTFPSLSPSIAELKTSILAPSSTLSPPSLPNVNSSVPSFAPALAPLPSPCDANENATSNQHAYLMQEIMSNDADVAAAAAAYGDEDDNCSSPDNRTLDLISQLDPTRNFLCLIDQQSGEQSGHKNVNDGDAAPGPSVVMGPLDLDFKI